ncbi:butyrophilin subfamily 1 member A1-like isoform X1 [Carassius auratus]|uniref:Butyrophilin subfamily 1 member A1-like isoform X1 n=2 Tax=Carassius auratus TaxID=7957 RepID=A0A6P6NKF1_CARAU|nr:butyrophilin subfamily 1 member A1-like isoform X1 [Carassius auratus]
MVPSIDYLDSFVNVVSVQLKHSCSSEMKLFCLILLIINGITVSRSEQYEVVGPSDPVLAVAGEDVILSCSVKPLMSVVDMRVEWSRPDLRGSLVHLYEEHEDKNTDQSQYRGRTKLNLQELHRGNASLKLSSVQVSDEGRYMCFIQSKFWFDDTTVDVKVEAVGSPPVITVDGFDDSGGLRLQCESEGWYPEPVLEWLDSEGVRLSSETTDTHRGTDRFSVKHTITVHHRDDKIHCRVKLRHHMLETLIIGSSNMFNSWKNPINLISVIVVVIVIAGIAGLLIAVFFHKNRELSRDFHFLQSQKSHIQDVITYLRKHKVNVILDADTAHPHLIMSSDGKHVRYEEIQLERVDWEEEQNDKFDKYLAILGKEGFSTGCFYYEVQVKGQTVWDLGVARESTEKKGSIDMNILSGYWTTCLRYVNYLHLSYDSSEVLFPLKTKPQRVGVFVDYEKGQVSFYDVDSSSHIYSYTDQSFNEKIYPFLSLGYKSNENSTALVICDDY